jgi:hypothetical protein
MHKCRCGCAILQNPNCRNIPFGILRPLLRCRCNTGLPKSVHCHKFDWSETKKGAGIVMLLGARRIGDALDYALVSGNLEHITEGSEDGIFG